MRLIIDAAFFTSVAIGDLEGFLTSPSGIVSQLMRPNSSNRNRFLTDATGAFIPLDWIFTSNAFWGEDPAGDWTLSLFDRPGGGSRDESRQVRLVSFEATARYGSLIPVPEPGTFVLLAMGLAAIAVQQRRRRPATADNAAAA